MTVYLMSHVYRHFGPMMALAAVAWSAPAVAAPPSPVSAGKANDGGPAVPVASLRRVRLETLSRRGNGYIAQMDNGGHAELTLDPRLQEAAEETLDAFQVPYGAAVVLSIPDGRVLALAGRSAAAPELG